MGLLDSVKTAAISALNEEQQSKTETTTTTETSNTEASKTESQTDSGKQDDSQSTDAAKPTETKTFIRQQIDNVEAKMGLDQSKESFIEKKVDEQIEQFINRSSASK